MIVLHTAHQSSFEGQMRLRKHEEDIKDGI